MLIDAGDNDKWGWQDSTYVVKPGEKLVRYINHFLAPAPSSGTVDYVMITHFHSDHIGNGRDALPGTRGYGLSGITLVGERLHFGKLVDRMAGL